MQRSRTSFIASAQHRRARAQPISLRNRHPDQQVAHLVVEVAEIQSQADAARHAILDTATDSEAASPLMHVRNASPVVGAVIPAAAITEILFGVLAPRIAALNGQ